MESGPQALSPPSLALEITWQSTQSMASELTLLSTLRIAAGPPGHGAPSIGTERTFLSTLLTASEPKPLTISTH